MIATAYILDIVNISGINYAIEVIAVEFDEYKTPKNWAIYFNNKYLNFSDNNFYALSDEFMSKYRKSFLCNYSIGTPHLNVIDLFYSGLLNKMKDQIKEQISDLERELLNDNL